MPRFSFHLRSLALVVCSSLIGIIGSASAAAVPTIAIELSGPVNLPVDQTVSVVVANASPVHSTTATLSIATRVNGTWTPYVNVIILIPIGGAARLPVSGIIAMVPAGTTLVRLSIVKVDPSPTPAYYEPPRTISLVPVILPGQKTGGWDISNNKTA